MANCNKLFFDFDKNLNIKKKKKESLKHSKEVLRSKIRKYFKDNHPDYKPEFYIQGSYKMGTTILTKDDECDLDDGVYFKREIGVSGTTLQTWIKNAVEDATSTTPEHRKKCVRVLYKSDYHIDFPVYYFPTDNDHPLLAVKNENLQESDPKEVVEWYFNQKDTNGQFHRTTKYLKAWGDFKRNKMPSGLAMSILAAENMIFNDRDDISLKDTLIKIQKSLNKKFECIVPGTPYDDLFDDYDDSRKNNFISNLKNFIEDAKKACNDESNQFKASKLWRKHMGSKFPFGADEDTDAKESTLRELSAKVLNGTAFTQKDGSISSSNGVKNKSHTNYGS